jgi:hypothetical protein
MAHFDFALLAQSVSVDRESNNLSIINVIDELTVPRETPDPPKGKILPAGFSFFLLMVWERSSAAVPETKEGRVLLVGPNSKRPAGIAPIKIDLTGTNLRCRIMLRTDVLPYQGPGTYTFVVQLKAGAKWRRVGSRTMKVTKANA